MAAVFTGCLAPKGVGLWIEDGRVNIEDGSFAENLSVGKAVASRTPDGFLVAKVAIRNTNKSDFPFEYRFEWKDGDGAIQTHVDTNWRRVSLHGRDTANLSGVSPLPGTDGYILKIRRAGADDGDAGTESVAEAIGTMLADPDFDEIYRSVEKLAGERGHARPTIAVRPVEDNRKAGASDAKSGGRMHREIKTALRRTGKFTVIDYSLVAARGAVDASEVDIGIKRTNVDGFGEYAEADFVLLPELRKDGGNRVFLDMSIVGADGTLAVDGSVRLGRQRKNR